MFSQNFELFFFSTVKACLDLMSAWTHTYIQKTADTCTTADIGHHGPFYSVCQALFYIFAFRHKQLLAMPNGKDFNIHTKSKCRICLLETRTLKRLSKKSWHWRLFFSYAIIFEWNGNCFSYPRSRGKAFYNKRRITRKLCQMFW